MLGAVSRPRQADGRRSTATLAADVRLTVRVLGVFTVARGETPLAPREIGSHQGRSRVFAGTNPAHLYRSDDLGKHWQEVASMRDVPSVDQWSFCITSGIERIAWATISRRTSSWPKLVHLHIVRTVEGKSAW